MKAPVMLPACFPCSRHFLKDLAWKPSCFADDEIETQENYIIWASYTVRRKGLDSWLVLQEFTQLLEAHSRA